MDDATVPYHLLDDRPAPGDHADDDVPAGGEPAVFWVDDGDLLVPTPASATCPVDVATLLDELSAGPTQQVRDQGLATALPPDARLRLVATDGDLVVVDLETETQFSADRLPTAMGQLVLTLTSVPDTDRVSLLSNGEPVRIPDAEGALRATPVTSDAYRPLVPPRYRQSPPFADTSRDDQRCPSSG